MKLLALFAPEMHILICTHSNSAANLYVEGLHMEWNSKLEGDRWREVGRKRGREGGGEGEKEWVVKKREGESYGSREGKWKREDKGVNVNLLPFRAVGNVLQWNGLLQISKAVTVVMQVVLSCRAWVRPSSSVQTVLHW